MSPRHPADDSASALINAFIADSEATALSLTSLSLSALPPALLALPPAAAARLTRLDLANNDLATLPTTLHTSLPSLRILFLPNNAFSTLPPLSLVTSLRMLSFKNNALSSLDTSRLPPSLTWLILTSNNLTSLPEDFSTRCASVRKLMLSNNALSSLPKHFPPPACELLRLSNNNLATLPSALFTSPALAWLGLGGNPATPTAPLPRASHLSLAAFHIASDGLLGRGASGDVFRATDASGAAVAVKIFEASTTSDGSVLDEIAAALSLSGQGLIPVHGYIAEAGKFGLVMDLVDGMAELGTTPSFASITRDVYPEQRFASVCVAVTVLGQVAAAAAAVHRAGFAHGDLYGHNVLVNEATGRSCLTDFGASFPCDARMERIEVRAFGIMVEEVVRASRICEGEEVGAVQLKAVAKRCAQLPMESRPSFREVVDVLQGVERDFKL